MSATESAGRPSPVHDGIHSFAIQCRIVTDAAPSHADALRHFLRRVLTRISRACVDAGAVDIGHIKAHLRHEGGYLYGSTVGNEGAVTVVTGQDADAVPDFELTLNAVVFGLATDAVKRAGCDGLAESLADAGYRRDRTKGEC